MSRLVPFLIFVVAFTLRVGVRLFRGRDDLLTNGYLQYLDLARNWIGSGDFVVGTYVGPKAAFWPPIYPFFVTIFLKWDDTFVIFAILSATVGSLTAVLAFLIGRDLFDRATGILAGCCAGVYPYFVFHDASIQDTAMFTCVTAASIWLLMQAQEKDKYRFWALSGIFLGLAALTRASILPYLFLLFPWLLIRHRIKALIVIAACVLTIAPWLIRNYYKIGVPVLTSQTGRFLWVAHNPSTFMAYPLLSIDDSEIIAWTQLSEEERASIESMGEVEQSDYFWEKGRDFVLGDPRLAIKQSFEKIWVGFSWNLSPHADGMKQIGYFLSYFPILVLGIFGVILSLGRRKDMIIIYLLFINFMIGTALFWAHTSHRMFLEIYLMIFAASAISWLWARCSKHRKKDMECSDYG